MEGAPVPERPSSVGRNITVMMGSQLVMWASTFLLMIILPRYLGSEEYGRLFLAMSLAMMAQVFVEFGGLFFVAKEVARDHAGAGALIADSIGLRLGLSAVALVVCILFAVLAGYPSSVILLIAILVAAKVWEGALGVVVAAFQGFERMEFRSVTSIVERVFLSLVAVAGVLLGGRSVYVALVMALSTLISMVVGFRFLRRIVPSLPSIRWSAMVDLVRKGAPYLMMSVFAVIYFRINTIMLSLQTTDQIVGWFGAAFRFFDILMFFPTIVNLAIFPVLSRVASDHGVIARTARRGMEMVMLAALPVGIGAFAFADVIITVLFGAHEFANSIPVLRMLAFGVPIIYVNFVLVSTLIAVDKQKAWSYVALGAIPLSVGLNALLIPLFQSSSGNGGIGSALATDITELGIMIAAIILMPRYVFAGGMIGKMGKVGVAGAAMAILVGGLRMLDLPWLAQAVAGVVLYGVTAVALGAISRGDLATVRSALSPRNWKQIVVSPPERI
jgi:O-antigen/teichoic acid export membrane protein